MTFHKTATSKRSPTGRNIPPCGVFSHGIISLSKISQTIFAKTIDIYAQNFCGLFGVRLHYLPQTAMRFWLFVLHGYTTFARTPQLLADVASVIPLTPL